MRYYKKNENNLSDLRSHIVRNSALFLRISYGTKNLFRIIIFNKKVITKNLICECESYLNLRIIQFTTHILYIFFYFT